MPTVHLESDDGVSIHLADVDGDTNELLDAIGSLAADAPTVSVVPCGAQFGVGPVRARTDFNDDVLTAVHEVVHYVIAGTGTLSVTTADFHQSAPDVAILDAIEFTKLVVDDGTRHEFALQPDTDEFHLQGGHDQSTHGNRGGAGSVSTPKYLVTPEEAARFKVRRDAARRDRIAATDADLASKHADLYGSATGDLDADLDRFFGGSLTRTAPFRAASRLKRGQMFNRELVNKTLAGDRVLRDIDPRTLHSTQPSITRPGIRYYLGDTYGETGRTYADQYQRGNADPVIYKNPRGQYMILSGHHRAAAALLQGRDLSAVVIEPGLARRVGERISGLLEDPMLLP